MERCHNMRGMDPHNPLTERAVMSEKSCDVQIPDADMRRIEEMVDHFRLQLMSQYRLAYLQGQIDSAVSTRERLAS